MMYLSVWMASVTLMVSPALAAAIAELMVE